MQDQHNRGTPQTPLIDELLYLRAKVKRLEDGHSDALFVANRQLDLAMQEVQRLQGQEAALQIENEYLRLELSRAKVGTAEAKRLQAKIDSIMGICAISHEQMHANTKLALITGPEQPAYSAVNHGGNPEDMLTSMRNWSISMGGNANNPKCTNVLNEALKPVDGTWVDKEQVDTGDGKKHYKVTFDEELYRHPRFYQKEGDPYKDNGGDKRCPNCKGPLKRDVRVIYECAPCGINYDRDLNPLINVPLAATSRETASEAEEQPAPNVIPLTQRMEMGTTPLPPRRCFNCNTTHPSDFRWNGVRWNCHSGRKIGCL